MIPGGGVSVDLFKLIPGFVKHFLQMKQTAFYLCLIGFSILLGIGGWEPHCSAKPFGAFGTFENTIVNEKVENVSVVGRFEVFVDGCKWRIRTVRQDEPLDYFEAGSDLPGEIYFVGVHTNVTTAAAKEVGDAKKAAELEVAFGQIIAGEVPHFAAAEPISILWLAYASSCYFQTRTNDQIEPVYWFGGQHFFNEGLLLRGIWVVNDLPPFLPSRVVYFNDGFFRGLKSGQIPVVKRYEEPYQNGFTNAVFEVLSHENLDGQMVPSKFSLTIYRPKALASSATELIISRKFDFTMGNCSVQTTPENFKPVLIGLTAIKDYRFSKTNGAIQYTYHVSNHWPSVLEVVNDRQLYPILKPPPAVNSAIGGDNRMVRLVLWMVFVGSLFGLLWLVKTLKKKQI